MNLGARLFDPSEPLITVPFASRSFRTTFAALDFRYEREVRFDYRLVGFDDAWMSTRDRNLVYAGLPAGSYTFEIKARTPVGSSPRPASVSFRILPPWWQTWWFSSIMIGCVILVARLLWRWRLHRLIHERRRLEKAVEERTREVIQEKTRVEEQNRKIEGLLVATQEANRLKS